MIFFYDRMETPALFLFIKLSKFALATQMTLCQSAHLLDGFLPKAVSNFLATLSHLLYKSFHVRLVFINFIFDLSVKLLQVGLLQPLIQGH